MCQHRWCCFNDNTGIYFHTNNPCSPFKCLIQAGSNPGRVFIPCSMYTNFYLPKIISMRSLLYLIAVILIIGWLLGVFVYSATGLIHVLIVLAIVALLLGIIRRA